LPVVFITDIPCMLYEGVIVMTMLFHVLHSVLYQRHSGELTSSNRW